MKRLLGSNRNSISITRCPAGLSACVGLRSLRDRQANWRPVLPAPVGVDAALRHLTKEEQSPLASPSTDVISPGMAVLWCLSWFHRHRGLFVRELDICLGWKERDTLAAAATPPPHGGGSALSLGRPPHPDRSAGASIASSFPGRSAASTSAAVQPSSWAIRTAFNLSSRSYFSGPSTHLLRFNIRWLFGESSNLG